MSKIPMTSTATHRYEGKNLVPGTPFEVNCEEDASDLETMSFAKRDRSTYATRVLVADQPSAGVNAAEAKPASADNRRPRRTQTVITK